MEYEGFFGPEKEKYRNTRSYSGPGEGLGDEKRATTRRLWRVMTCFSRSIASKTVICTQVMSESIISMLIICNPGITKPIISMLIICNPGITKPIISMLIIRNPGITKPNCLLREVRRRILRTRARGGVRRRRNPGSCHSPSRGGGWPAACSQHPRIQRRS